MNVRLVSSSTETPDSAKKSKMIESLRSLLQETCRLKNQGALATLLAQKQGYADGYMNALLDAGWATETELLALIARVRRGENGPATGRVSADVEASDWARASA